MIRNPILPGFNPDPSILRVDDDYYIATSTFEWYPGVQIHHSRDLVHWRLLTRPLNRAAQLNMLGDPDSCGIWAPCLSYDGGFFYLIYTDVKRYGRTTQGVTGAAPRDMHNYLVTSRRIDGEWSDPVYLNSSGFDPSLFHDDDGRKYLLNMVWDFRPGQNRFAGISLQEYHPESRALVGNPHIIFEGTSLGFTEGPHLYKWGGYYYLITAEGGTGWGHAVTMARSRSFMGPYELHPDAYILTSRNRPDVELQRAGHADLVETQSGETYMVHLCGRPLRNRGRCTLGRETAIQKMKWCEDGWLRTEDYKGVPLVEVEDPGLPVCTFLDPPVRDDFNETELPLSFQWLRSPWPEELFSLSERPGYLRLYGREYPGSLFRQSLVARRQQAHCYSASTVVEFDPKTYQHLEELTPHYEDEYRMMHRDGSYLWMLGRGISVRNSSGKAYRMAGSQTDISRGKVVDVLTGLPNRVLFMDRLRRSFERVRRKKDKTAALIFLDLDSFKLINDSLGHMIGDQLLVAIAARLESTLRASDSVARFSRNHTIARLGGDEFTILLEDITSARDATRVAERISNDLAMPFMVAGQELFPSASIGIALYNPSYQNPEEMLRDADTAMYSAKAIGKGRYEIFDADMRANTLARLQLETDFRRAIERREFENYYQMIVSLETGRVLGFETLVRWKHTAKGIISPREFITVAEETGLIVPLGQWVLQTACQQMRFWQTRFQETPPLIVSINLSARHFLQSDLVQQCRAVLYETQLSHSSLCIEVTESAMMPNPESAIELMHQLKSLGVQIALDDFGTGYSSLSYLHRFPLDSLKIDRAFVSRIVDDDEIVRTILTLGRNLGLKVVAEGVETEEQAAKLRQLGCEYAQGYFFSAPVSAQDATDLLASHYRWPGTVQAGNTPPLRVAR